MQEIAGILKIANQNSNFLTLQKLEFQKNLTRIFGIVNGIGILPPMGVPEIGTKNWNSQPRPLGTTYLSHKPCLIKVINIALSETTKADDIAIKTAKTGKVTAVVMVMSIFKKKRCKMRSAYLRNEKPSCQKAKGQIFQKKIPAD